ncbi:P-loop containing nucleoside triphosphate hydrolase protein [Trametes meyenii]|nr:P-loop containing nucleoside triphosphate hydrolase protein [Trametes meyenii]
MRHIGQSLISSYLGRDVPNIIFVHQLSLADLGPLTARLEGSAAPTCGIALHVSKDSDAIGAVAFATSTEVFYISPTDPVASSRAGTARTGRSNLARILDGSLAILAGFGMARLALHLHHQWGLPVHGVDLSTLFTPSTRNPDSAAEFASRRIHPSVNKGKIHAVWYGDNVDDVCLRAWLSAFLAAESVAQIRAARKVDTSLLDESHLACLSKLFLNVELLEAQRPTQTDTQFDGVAADKDGRLIIQNARYKTRVRKSTQTSIIMETSHGQQVVGHAVHAEGKRTGVLVASGAFRGTIERIRIVGRKGLTHAELAREEFILLLLQGVLSSLTRSPYIRMLWLSDGRAQQRSRTALLTDPLGLHFSHINASQRQVVAAMLSQDDEPLVVVHGPPGTGKTTTIAAALDYWTAERKPTWVIAQSNVGIKNVARTLVKYDIDFRLLVSKEFYVEWHEHLYTAINRCLIRSDELFGDQVSAERKISGSSIILCTISMLSNPAIDNCGIFRLVPVERLVVDEASQIDTLEFMHLFHKFRNLEKVCMFGDPKQLPPYGKDAAPNMKTIYDFKQFKAAAYFLNTQYRMPIPLGQFISDHVYDSKLLSVHMITDRNAVCLVDVHKGEEEHAGSSWKVCISCSVRVHTNM